MKHRRTRYRVPFPLSARAEKAKALRDLTEMRASTLCFGAAGSLMKQGVDLTAFDNLRDFINTEVESAVADAAAAKRRFEKLLSPSPRHVDAEFIKSPRSRKPGRPPKREAKAKG